MRMSDRIEAFILELMKQEQEDRVRIQRNELAQLFGCVPSQINYVIATRFSPERGYSVESRRGGGGGVVIRRLPRTGMTEVYIPDEISAADAGSCIMRLEQTGAIEGNAAAVMKAAVSDGALSAAANSERVRADVLRSMIRVLAAL